MSIFEYNEEIEMKKIRALDYNEGKEDGRNIGVAENTINIIANIMKKSKVSLEEACEIIGITVEEYNAKKEILKYKEGKGFYDN